jgi:hypothetical protein
LPNLVTLTLKHLASLICHLSKQKHFLFSLNMFLYRNLKFCNKWPAFPQYYKTFVNIDCIKMCTLEKLKCMNMFFRGNRTHLKPFECLFSPHVMRLWHAKSPSNGREALKNYRQLFAEFTNRVTRLGEVSPTDLFLSSVPLMKFT